MTETLSDIVTPDILTQALRAGDYTRAIRYIPYFKMLNLSAEQVDEELIVTMGFDDHLIGNPMIPALHGGTISAMLEATGLLTTLSVAQDYLPKTINQTINFLSTGHPKDLFATARIIKKGKRVAVVDAIAWQEPSRDPVATMRAQYKLNS